jgi:hypothetical protein
LIVRSDMAAPMIELEDVSKTYGEGVAVAG